MRQYVVTIEDNNHGTLETFDSLGKAINRYDELVQPYKESGVACCERFVDFKCIFTAQANDSTVKITMEVGV